MIQGQQSFAQLQDKVAVDNKHSLTSLECYEYASKTKQLQDTVIVDHAVTNISLTMMELLQICVFVEANICRPDVKAAIMPVAYDLNHVWSR